MKRLRKISKPLMALVLIALCFLFARNTGTEVEAASTISEDVVALYKSSTQNCWTNGKYIYVAWSSTTSTATQSSNGYEIIGFTFTLASDETKRVHISTDYRDAGGNSLFSLVKHNGGSGVADNTPSAAENARTWSVFNSSGFSPRGTKIYRLYVYRAELKAFTKYFEEAAQTNLHAYRDSNNKVIFKMYDIYGFHKYYSSGAPTALCGSNQSAYYYLSSGLKSCYISWNPNGFLNGTGAANKNLHAIKDAKANVGGTVGCDLYDKDFNYVSSDAMAQINAAGYGSTVSANELNSYSTVSISLPVYTITLNSQSATTAGTSSFYEAYGVGFFSHSSCASEAEITSENITPPTKTGYTFGGYYTGTNGTGTQYITAMGSFSSNMTTTTFTANTTLYAYWKTDYTVTVDPNGGTMYYVETSGGSVITELGATKYENEVYSFDSAQGNSPFFGIGTTYEVLDAKIKELGGAQVMASGVTNPTRDGYVFAGWEVISGSSTISSTNYYVLYNPSLGFPTSYAKYYVTVSGDVVIRAKWNPKITVDPDGGTMYLTYPSVTKYNSAYTRAISSGSAAVFSYSYTYEEISEIGTSGYCGSYYLTTPTKEGYIFDGWEIVSGDGVIGTSSGIQMIYTGGIMYYDYNAYNVTITKPTTIKAKWKGYDYTVTLDGNGATNTSYTTSVIATDGQPMPTPISLPERTYNIAFVGNGGEWYNDNMLEYTSSEVRGVSYTFNGYYTTKNNLGSTAGTQYYTFEGKSSRNWDKQADTTLYASWTAFSTELPTPTRTGYTFTGWSTSSTATSGVTGDYTPTADITLYACWKVNSYNYSVKHYTQNLDGTYTLDNDATVTGTANFGTTITGELESYTGFKAPTKKSMTIATSGNEIEYYYDRETYTVTLTKGTGISSVTGAGDYLYGSTVTLGATASTGYTWSKWSGDYTSTTNAYSFTMPANDVSMTANATINKYTVIFEDYDGTTLKTQSVNYGSSATAPSNPTRTGYNFTGWDKTFNKIVADTTVTAQYTIKTYTVKFVNYDGTVLKTETVNHGSGATAPANPTRPGYEFSGWDCEFDNITADTTVTALYGVNEFTVTFKDHDGTVLKTQTVNYGSAATAPTNPTRTGYTFTGWDKEFTSVKTNMTVTAQYKINTYTVTFKDHDGTTISTQTVNYGSGATAPSSPTRTGYTFSGWDKAFTNITSDLTVTAQYTVNTYTITYDLAGGSVSTANPTSYNITTSTFTLNNPTKAGYTFKGWTGSNGTTASTSVSIKKGSTGNKTYTANWTTGSYSYTVKYYLMNVSGSGYTLENSATVTGSADFGATVTGEIKTFTGFTSPTTEESVTIGTSENVISYYYDRNKHTVTLSKGTGISSVLGAGGYYYGASVTVEATLKSNTTQYTYGWSKWSGTSTSNDQKYTFTMPDSNVSLTANGTQTTNEYTQVVQIRYEKADGTFTEYEDVINKKYSYGSTVSWSREADATYKAASITSYNVSGDKTTQVTVYRNTYTVTLTKGAGISSVTGAGTYRCGATVTLGATTSTGYAWSKWTGTYESTTKAYSFTMPTSDVSMTANATGITYYVKFDANGGTGSMENLTCTYGTAKNLTANAFTRTGYTFSKWNTKADGTGTSYSDKASVSTLTSTSEGTVTLYAQWTPNKYTVTLDGNEATSANHTSSVTATYDSAMPSITKPTRSYKVTFDPNGGSCSTSSLTSTYTFNGYYTTKNAIGKTEGTQYYTSAGASAKNWDKTSDTTLYASWTDSSIALPTPTRTGYTFKGWSTNSTSTSGVTGNYTPTSDVTLYATWSINTSTLEVIAGSGGTVSTTGATKGYKETITVTAVPTNYTATFYPNGGSCSVASLSSNLKFSKWTKGSTFYGTLNDTTAATAVYTFGSANGVTDTITANFTGSYVITLPTPTRTGYTFKGWATSSTAASGVTGNYTLTKNVDLYAVWVDDTKPTGSISVNPTGWTDSKPIITAIGADTGSGVKSVAVYNSAGTLITSSQTAKTTYTVTTVGESSYYAVITDVAGNTYTTGSITAYYDNVNPVPDINSVYGWYKANTKINLAAADAHSGIKKLEILSGTTVLTSSAISPVSYTFSTEGISSYTLKVTDNVNLSATASFKVKIDKTLPVLIIPDGTIGTKLVYNHDYTFKSYDTVSGIKAIYINGVLKDSNTEECKNTSLSDAFEYTTSFATGGEYTIKIVDFAGNEVSQTIYIYEDTESPEITYMENAIYKTTDDKSLSFEAEDDIDGIKTFQIKDPQGNVIARTDFSVKYTLEAEVSAKLTEAGNYTIYVEDYAGHVTERVYVLCDAMVVDVDIYNYETVSDALCVRPCLATLGYNTKESSLSNFTDANDADGNEYEYFWYDYSGSFKWMDYVCVGISYITIVENSDNIVYRFFDAGIDLDAAFEGKMSGATLNDIKIKVAGYVKEIYIVFPEIYSEISWTTSIGEEISFPRGINIASDLTLSNAERLLTDKIYLTPLSVNEESYEFMTPAAPGKYCFTIIAYRGEPCQEYIGSNMAWQSTATVSAMHIETYANVKVTPQMFKYVNKTHSFIDWINW